jgi:hypothetical protein
MRILVAGASGLIGTALVQFLGAMGHEICRLVRARAVEDTDIPWDPAAQGVSRAALEGFDAAVCLSGAGIADKRWTPSRRSELRDSRLDSAGLLASALATCRDRPECLVCASATGIYGADRGAEVLTEDSPAGMGFLASLCTDWEAATLPAQHAGIRVVNLRFGIVLTAKGGALNRMLLPFRAGLGGRLGSGRQFVSWLGLDDAVGIVDYVIQSDSLGGPVNAVSPNPLTNAEFTHALGRALHRPAIMRVPAFALRAAMGEMSELVLGSLRAYPRRLEAAGYRFRHAGLAEALSATLAQSAPG